ncbi:MAG TPA: LEA type 2 family protein [Longimicrobium sp.]|jgi:hypothetical protein
MISRRTIQFRRGALLLALVLALPGCATIGLQDVLSAPTFRVDEGQQAQLRILPPSAGRPTGGAAVRLYARVGNPNPIALTLSTLAGRLQLDGREAAEVSFPLGVPLAANGEVVVPIDVAINFSDLPGLGNVLLNAISGRPVRYQLNGTVGVDAGLLGRPTFGPSTLLSGDLRVTR